jgi:hypothetical protein
MTADVRRMPRRGTRPPTPQSVRQPSMDELHPRCATRPSLGPSTRSRPPHGNIAGASSGGEAFTEASRSGKPAQAGGTDTGVTANGRSAARRVSPAFARRSRVTRQKRKEVMASVPARIDELGFGSSHVVTQLQKSSGDEWSRIRSANALQKERPCRVNRGLARSEGRRVAPSSGASSETVVAGRAPR